MDRQAVYVRVGCAEGWLGDIELSDFELDTIETALPGFLVAVGRSTGAIALEHGED